MNARTGCTYINLLLSPLRITSMHSIPTSLRRVCLVGVRGTGKTTLIRSAIERLPSFEVVTGSAVIREIAGSEFAHFDQLPSNVKRCYREAAIEWIERLQVATGKHLLCEGHTTLLDERSRQIEAIFTERDCKFFREIVLLEASPDEIFARRKGDLSKRRSLDPNLILAEIEAERETTKQIAMSWGMTLYELSNSGYQTITRRLEEILC